MNLAAGVAHAQQTARFLAKREGARWRFVQRIDTKTLAVTWAEKPARAAAFQDGPQLRHVARYLGLHVLDLPAALDAIHNDPETK
jgi:hypothetical protein